MGSFQGGSNIIYINLNVYRERPPARSMGIVYMVIMQIVITDILGHAPFLRKQLNVCFEVLDGIIGNPYTLSSSRQFSTSMIIDHGYVMTQQACFSARNQWETAEFQNVMDHAHISVKTSSQASKLR